MDYHCMIKYVFMYNMFPLIYVVNIVSVVLENNETFMRQ